jgi:hypothetical protein
MIFMALPQPLANRSRWDNMQVSTFYFILMGVAFLCAVFAHAWETFFMIIAIARICDKQQIL